MKNIKHFIPQIRNQVTGFVLLTVLMVAGGCHRGSPSPDTDLIVQRKRIQKQIDSLKKELVRIDKMLKDTAQVDIPFIQADTVEPTTFVKYIDLQGDVKTDGNINVMPEFQGEVVKIYKKVGDKVRKGDLIMKIDDKVLRNQLAEVQTQYNLAVTAYERQKRLWEQKIGSEMEYLKAKTNKDALYRKLLTLRAQLKKARVTAPISGTIDDIMVKEGEMAGPQRPVARIVNLDKVYAEADVSEKYLTKIRKGTPVDLYFPELNKEVKGKVDYTANFIHPVNRTYKVRIYLDNTDGLLKPNLTAHIKVLESKREGAVVLPSDLVLEDRDGNTYVFVLVPTDKPGIYRAQRRYVQTGDMYQNRVLIEQGLKPGDIIPLSGARGLTEGDLVKLDQSAK